MTNSFKRGIDFVSSNLSSVSGSLSSDAWTNVLPLNTGNISFYDINGNIVEYHNQKL